MIKAITIISSMMITSAAFGQSLGVREYIEQACNYSREIKSSMEDIEYAQWYVKLTRSALRPSLSLSADSYYSMRDNSTPTMTVDRYSTALTATLSQNIYYSKYYSNLAKSAEVSSEAATLSQDYTTDGVISSATSIYWSAVAASEYVEAAKEYLRIIQQTYEIIEMKYNDGIMAKNDLLMMETRLKQAQYSMTQADKNLKTAMITANIFIGCDATQPLELNEDIIVSGAELPTLGSVETIITHLDKYKISLLDVEQSEISLDINSATYLPKLSIGAVGSYGTDATGTSSKYTTDGYFYLKLTAPLFSWRSKQKKLMMDRALVQKANYSLETTSNSLESTIYDSYLSLSESYELLEVTALGLEVAKESLELSIYSNQEGLISVVELLSAQLSWITAYNNKINANLSYRIALVEYLDAIGELKMVIDR